MEVLPAQKLRQAAKPNDGTPILSLICASLRRTSGRSRVQISECEFSDTHLEGHQACIFIVWLELISFSQTKVILSYCHIVILEFATFHLTRFHLTGFEGASFVVDSDATLSTQ